MRLRYIETDRSEKADADKLEEEIVVTTSECVVDLAHILLSLFRPRRYHSNSERAVSYRTTHYACQIILNSCCGRRYAIYQPLVLFGIGRHV